MSEIVLENRLYLGTSELLALAAEGLKAMFIPERQAFCFTLKQSDQGMVRHGISKRYTIMTVLGLHRFANAGGISPIELRPVLDQLISDTTWIKGVGDLGLILWLCAVVSPENLAALSKRLRPLTALNRYSDARNMRTMELAWFLTGLSLSAATGGAPGVLEEASIVFNLLASNQGTSGLFGHLGRKRTMVGLVRGYIGSFADQVYPIYAFTKFARVTGNQESVDRALACAAAICKLQGPKGEWWWHYDSDRGSVVESYPVYSVHQDGMAPMALLELGDFAGADFSTPIRKGLSWISGNNDLNRDMRSEEFHVVWRNISVPRWNRYMSQLSHAISLSQPAKGTLSINFECRPYELGWALYALASVPQV